ncbi:MAG: O-antigen ligase family protein [Nitrospiraceae bacterium]|nr:O-antigen ligase family protein [Nitrospiraceae bacterium]
MEVAVKSKKFGKKKMPTIRHVTPWYVEYGFYASLVYGLMGPILGLEIDRLGIVILALLACFCFLSIGERPVDFFKALILPIGLGLSFLIIQMMFHGISVQHDYVKMFIPWILTLIVVQALSFRRGFLHRFVFFALLMGGLMLLFIDIKEYGTEGITRLAVEKGAGLSNSNALADWFGFCAVYMYMYGVVAERQEIRLISWILATGCLLVVTLTVSRGALLAIIIAIVLGSREILKRGFLPLLILFLLVWIAYGVGLFDQAITFYTMRATEESGRFLVWPRAFESFMNSPFRGVGVDDVYVFVPEKAKVVTPHNGFLFIAMASGIIPLLFYMAYWMQAGWAALCAPIGKIKTASFYLPLVAYAFLICLASNSAFMNSWVVVTLAAAMTSYIQTQSPPPRIVMDKNFKRGNFR